MSNTIADYVAAARRGDQNAFSKLFEFTNQKAYYTALKITKKEQDAEDMVQDAYIKAFTSLDSLTDDGKFESWLNMIVANKCRDYLKKKKPDLFSKYESDDSDIAFEDTLENNDISLLPETVTENEATRQIVMQCIDKLPDDQKLCVVMFYYDELSVKEIAVALQIPEGTVKSRLSKARKTLKKEFEQLEKRDKIKLHGVPFVPLMRWVFQKGSQSDKLPRPAFRNLEKTIIEALKNSGKIAAGIKAAGGAVLVKILAVSLAVVVAVTAAGFGVKALIDRQKNDSHPADTSAVATAEIISESENEQPYYSESPLAVRSKDNQFVYYISDEGIIQKDTSGVTKIITSHVPKNLVFKDSLMYLTDGELYSYDGDKETKLQSADGAMLYENGDGFISISADRSQAYTLDASGTSSKLNVNGTSIKYIDGYLYYYDGKDNLCRTHPDGNKETVISNDYTKGFKAAYAIVGKNVYFAGFDSDVDGTIYRSNGGKADAIKLDEEGIRDFTVLGNDVYYATYKGKLYHGKLGGGGKLISENNYYHISNAGAYSLWAEMGTNDVYLIKAGSDTLTKTTLPNTVTAFEVLDGTVYFTTNEGHNTYNLGSD